MNVQRREVKTSYHIHRDNPQDLGDLMRFALYERKPVTLVRTDEKTGAVSRHDGRPTNLTADRVTLETADGGVFRCQRWEIDRAGVVFDDCWEAA